MNSVRTEKLLSILYAITSLLSLISLICIVTVWQYWTWTLNVCIDIDCGCILYSVNTFSKFMGGDVKICHFVTFATIPTILIGLIFGLYHGYRAFIGFKTSSPKIMACRPRYNNRSSINEDIVVVRLRKHLPYRYWVPTTFLAALISCFSLAHGVILTDGYYKTCEQYRKNLIQLLHSAARESEVIYNRLSCGAIFDFMDYIEPDSNNYRRSDEINTGLALQCAITSVWFNCFIWIGIFFINYIMNRKEGN